jgi:hypothetical protein
VNKPIRIWLDDIRDPKEHGWADTYTLHLGSQVIDCGDRSCVWAKTAEEAIELIRTHTVAAISFDHDLGLALSGYDVAKEIEQRCAEGLMPCPAWQIHSANPVGRANISLAMTNGDRLYQRDHPQSWEMFAHDVNGVFMHMGARRYVELHGLSYPIVGVKLTTDLQGDYWGWLETGATVPNMIWPSEAQLRICFPYGPEAEALRGRGKVYRFNITKT